MLFMCLVLWMDNPRELEPDFTSVTEHQTTILGKKINYRATAGTQPVWDEDNQLVASLFFTYYERTDVGKNTHRPLIISFNGGPGSASVWMHVAYTGPKVLNIDDEGHPVQPYGVRANPYSVLDVADIVFVNPVNTGYSRMVEVKDDKGKTVDNRKKFFGVNEDIQYLAEWINTFVTRQNRWLSPKYLIGESYGTTRVSGLALELQNRQWMYLNGVILVSPTGLGIDRDGPVNNALALPYMTAAAWFHQALPAELQSKDLDEILPEAEAFTIDEYLPALAKGGFISDENRQRIAEKVAFYSGIKAEVVLQRNNVLRPSFFWKELLREKGLTVGRLDSRYLGIDRMDGGERPDYSAELTAWLHAFTPAINYYMKNDLKIETDVKYNMFGPVRPWNRDGDETGENLRQAMAQNPFLHMMIQVGIYDGATDYFNAKYTMWQLDPSGKMRDRMRFETYRSGHMMYLRQEDLQSSNQHLREFIAQTQPKGPAQYLHK